MAAKIKFKDIANDLEIRISHTKRSEIPVILFLMVWLVGWGFGEMFALYSLFGKGTPVMVRIFFVIWVIPWTIGGGFAMLSVIKMLGGFELIEVGRGMLRITRSFVFLKLTKRYDIFKITGMHILHKNPGKFELINNGLIQFRCKGKDIRFGSGLSKDEKKEVFERIREHRDMNERNFQ